MQNRIMHKAPLLWFVLLNLLSLSVTALSVTKLPPQEESTIDTTTLGTAFWEWFDEYADDNGYVLDPVAYEQALQIRRDPMLSKDKILQSDNKSQQPVMGEEEL